MNDPESQRASCIPRCRSHCSGFRPPLIFTAVLAFMLVAWLWPPPKPSPFVAANESAGDVQHNFKPKDGYVPNAETAIAVAVAVWNPIYGKDKIAEEKPYNARLANGVWTVTGALPDGMVGGVAEIEISKDDCKVLRVSHGQ